MQSDAQYLEFYNTHNGKFYLDKLPLVGVQRIERLIVI